MRSGSTSRKGPGAGEEGGGCGAGRRGPPTESPDSWQQRGTLKSDAMSFEGVGVLVCNKRVHRGDGSKKLEEKRRTIIGGDGVYFRWEGT